MNSEVIKSWLLRANEKIQENKEYLSELDRAIGDGDHGINLSRGFQEVAAKIEQMKVTDIGDLLQQVAMTLIGRVGGASGPLYGTAFLKAATVLKGQEEIGLDELVNAMNASLEGIQQRGKATLGDKTMLDVWGPVITEWKTNPNSAAFEDLQALTQTSMEQTKEMEARKGRAAYLGKRSIGTYDPGAVSSSLILNALFTELKEVPK
jgi:phosphoenolpyruvate---glycerone phosphotransferase subunit DhaL